MSFFHSIAESFMTFPIHHILWLVSVFISLLQTVVSALHKVLYDSELMEYLILQMLSLFQTCTDCTAQNIIIFF